MSTFDQNFQRALAAIKAGQIVKESELPKRGTSAWKALSAQEKKIVDLGRGRRRDQLFKERESKAAFEDSRWRDPVWRRKVGQVWFAALPNLDYQAPTATTEKKGTVEIVVTGGGTAPSRLTSRTVAPSVSVVHGLHLHMRDLLESSHFDTIASAYEQTKKPFRHMASGKSGRYSHIQDDAE